jgi:hypothetical protein
MVDRFVFFDDVNFIKKGWINRNNILVNGKASLFTIPLKNASQNKLINEIELSDYPSWRENFLKTIEHNYSKAPFFSNRFEFINSFLQGNFSTINQLASESVKATAKLLRIETSFSDSTSLAIDKQIKGGQNKILTICKTLGGDQYVNPINGKSLYDKQSFESNQIKLHFLKMNRVEYNQANQIFIPSLSIIDVLMYNSDIKINQLLEQYTLEQ